MDALTKFETETYPRLWRLAYDAGEVARKIGLPRKCNLATSEHCHYGNVLKVYQSAWHQGYDGWQIPAIFAKMEATLDQLPRHNL